MIKYVIAMLIVMTMLVGVGAVYAESSSPKNFNEVEVIRGDPPGRPYKELGEINLTVPPGMARAQAVSLLKKKAFDDYNADAVISVNVSDKRTGGTPRKTVCPDGKMPCETTDPATFSETHATGTAVKWR